jgi:hypothetical protein
MAGSSADRSRIQGGSFVATQQAKRPAILAKIKQNQSSTRPAAKLQIRGALARMINRYDEIFEKVKAGQLPTHADVADARAIASRSASQP